jgi:hypothetical protein
LALKRREEGRREGLKGRAVRRKGEVSAHHHIERPVAANGAAVAAVVAVV